MSPTPLQQITPLAKADGHVDEDEARLLRTRAKRWGVPRDAVAVMLEGRANLVGQDVRGLPWEQAQAVLREMVAVVRVDGHLHPRELDLLIEAAQRFGVSASELTATRWGRGSRACADAPRAGGLRTIPRRGRASGRPAPLLAA